MTLMPLPDSVWKYRSCGRVGFADLEGILGVSGVSHVAVEDFSGDACALLGTGTVVAIGDL